jgi:flagellar hook protein FlgE
MIRSMFTAISALNLHQNYLDVISDNLANSNTTGYKASRVVFQDQFAQIMSSGSAPSASSGGINPTQVGLGVKLGYISPVFTQGMLQSTGRSTDLAIQGGGFFVYRAGDEQRFSREGSLEIDSTGYLVNNSTGMRIQGWTVPPNGLIVDTNQPVGDMQISLDATLAQATQNVVMGGNLDSTTATGGTVDSTFGVYDSLGSLHTVTARFTRTGANAWSWAMQDPGSLGISGTGTLAFDNQGHYTATGSAMTTPIVIPGSAGAANVSLATLPNFNLTKMTMLDAANGASARSQDGLSAGTVTDIYGSPNTGEVYLVYSNGLKQLIGQLALSHFTNPTGLLRAGQNLFKAGLNSGEAQIGAAGSGGRGWISSGYLEASNVDMAQEFTSMILAQRGFQASSRVISTSDEILQELVNLKR